jgi:iron complex transport system substrate-binding protein
MVIFSKATPVTMAIALVLAGACSGKDDRGTGLRPVKDIYGIPRQVPDVVARVACLDVLCYSTLIMLGEADKVVAMQLNAGRSPWVSRVRPPQGVDLLGASPSTELLLAQRADLVFGGYGGDREAEAFARAGLRQVRVQAIGARATTVGEFVESQKRLVRVFGEALGVAATEKVEAWCRWYDETIRRVTTRTRLLVASARPKAYFVRGPSALATHGKGAYVYWYGEMAGADMVVKDKSAAGDVSVEELIRWDPEVMFVGRQYPASLVLGDPRLRDIRAIRERRVLEVPAGVFFWDGGPECGLLLLYLAKHLHPEVFGDLDLAFEVKSYYRRFYRTLLDDREVDLLLRGLGPDGERRNSFGI